MNVVEECGGVVQACRELNANVDLECHGIGEMGVQNDKMIVGTLGALWGIVGSLFHSMGGMTTQCVSTQVQKRQEVERTLCPIFQSISRLTCTSVGLKGTIELSTLSYPSTSHRRNVPILPLLLKVVDSFTAYWGLKILYVLLAGVPATLGDKGKGVVVQRDKEMEFVNK
eukprot:11563100-Ditylum_brightwellii.AAC.1